MTWRPKTISVIGLGYIGLPTSAILANAGFKVRGMDSNKAVVDSVNKGDVHIVEPDLDKIVNRVVRDGMLIAYTEVQPADIYLICVPTPFHSNLSVKLPNTDFVFDAIERIVGVVKDGDLIILESTSPVGTTQKVKSFMEERGVDTNKLSIAYCPERVLPGKILDELITNDRVVGGTDVSSSKRAAEFYRLFVTGQVVETDSNTAEMCKLTENSYRDVNLAFANELSMICEKNQVNVGELINLANLHPRVNILTPGAGVGGHCIAVDPWFLVASDPENSRLIHQARVVNDLKPVWVVEKIKAQIAAFPGKPKVACLGVTFKANIDDLRESPALFIVKSLVEFGCDISVVEPNIIHLEGFELSNLTEALLTSDIIVILVNHKEFMDPSVEEILYSKTTLDFCGALIKR